MCGRTAPHSDFLKAGPVLPGLLSFMGRKNGGSIYGCVAVNFEKSEWGAVRPRYLPGYGRRV